MRGANTVLAATWVSLFLITVTPASSFSTPALNVDFAKKLDGVLGFFSQARASPEDEKREELKMALLQECKKSKAGKNREQIEEIISLLSPLSPTVATAESELLQKKWFLEWTTEKEINVFIEWGITDEVSQTISGPLLQNFIEFRKGGGLGVSGSLSVPDKTGKRTNFKFDTATIDFARWGKYTIPPVGEGWFDTVYLDDSLRVDCNSRDDILICTPFED